MQTPTNPENPYLALGQVADGGVSPGSSSGKSANTRKARKAAVREVRDEARAVKQRAKVARSGPFGRAFGVDHAGPTGFKAAPKRTRDLLGYQAMLPSGAAWLGGDEWSVTMQISDINYVAASDEQQEGIVNRWAKLLNSFGGGTRVQETIVNRVLADADVATLVRKPLTGDGFDDYRTDFNEIVRGKLQSASGNSVTEKFLTFTVQEPDREKAEATLNRVCAEVETHLKGMSGCQATRLDRQGRLESLAWMTRPYELFTFTEEEFAAKRRAGTHDFVAPFDVDPKEKSGPLVLRNGSGDTHHQVLWMRDYPVWLSDRLITELSELKADVTVSLHLEPIDQADGMQLVQRQIAELEMQKISEQRKLVKQGLDKEMYSQKVRDNLDEAAGLRDELKGSNQKLFSTVMVIGVSARSDALVKQHVQRVLTTVRKLSCTAETASYMQLDGFTTELPVGRRLIPMRRTLTTASAAIIVPFTTQELFVPGGCWYGVNAHSKNALVADRTKTRNGNGFILGTSGSGKGVFAKAEIANVFLSRPNDEIIIIDPEREYEPLVQAFDGQTIRIHAGSEQRVNPLDIERESPQGTDPVNAKCEFVLGLLESLVGGATGLTAEQRSVADRVAGRLYREYLEVPGTLMPTLQELQDGLAASKQQSGVDLARSLELYTSGSLAGFSKRTNVDVHARIMSWDISQLGPQLRTFGMTVILDHIWSRIVANHARGVRTWVYADEFQMLFDNPYSTQYFQKLYQRARKWGAMMTGITQNIEALLANDNARLMLANSDFLALLGQNETDADSLCDLLHFSDEQRRSFTGVQAGQGLLRSGTAVVAFDSRVPTDSRLFELFDTTFSER